MKIQDSIYLAKHKCFGENPEGFEQIMPMNILIGKNNSGKSTLLDLVEFLTTGKQEILTNGKSIVTVKHRLTETEIETGFSRTTAEGGIPGNHFEYGKKFLNQIVNYQLVNGFGTKYLEVEVDSVPYAKNYFDKIKYKTPLAGKIFIKISAERDIEPEGGSNTIQLFSNGRGATSLIQQILTFSKHDSRLINKKLLNALNEITKPDIEFDNIYIQQHDANNLWEIYFSNKQNEVIALSKMGSGMKTIILVLLNLLVKPEIENKQLGNYVFAFEELENNLHPALQRRLFNYLKEFSKINSVYFFITTHSNVVIDSFGLDENSQILHITNDGSVSKINTVLSFTDSKNILNDLEIKPSDLLQSNGIIWVEGPSDRIYLNHWIRLKDSNLIEGLHYMIMFYGGKLLAQLSYDYNSLTNELIPLLKINHNAFVMIDRDKKNITDELNETKQRIQAEIGNDNCWITRGREIENYLTEKTITEWLTNISKFKNPFKYSESEKIEDSIRESVGSDDIKYERSKPDFARQIIEYINEEDLKNLDLELNLENLIRQIRLWNKI